MSAFIIIIFLLSILHFIHESIIAPSMRMELRNELFKLRDQLRRMKIEKSIGEKEFEHLHFNVNFLLTRLSQITLAKYIEAFEALKDKEFREAVVARRRLIEHCENPEAMKILFAISKINERALLTNMGGWFIYCVPIAIVCGLFSKLKDLLMNTLCMPSKRAEEMFPIEKAAA